MIKKIITALTLSVSFILSGCASPQGNAASETSAAVPKIPEAADTQTTNTVAVSAVTAHDDGSDLTDPNFTVLRIGTLGGPTTMGMVKLIEDDKNIGRFDVKIVTDPAEIVAGIVNGEFDIANVPANLAANLYNKTGAEVAVLAINTTNTLYVAESENSIKSVADLKGRKIYSTGKGATPQYALEYLLTKNGVNPGEVDVEYLSEASEVAARLVAEENAAAILPQPFLSVAALKNPALHAALSVGDEWNKVSDSPLVTGVTIVRKSVLGSDYDAVRAFADTLQDSVTWVTDPANATQAAGYIADLKIVPSAEAAQNSLPYCGITYIDGDELQTQLSAYLTILGGQNPDAIGGAVPADDFYADEPAAGTEESDAALKTAA